MLTLMCHLPPPRSSQLTRHLRRKLILPGLAPAYAVFRMDLTPPTHPLLSSYRKDLPRRRMTSRWARTTKRTTMTEVKQTGAAASGHADLSQLRLPVLLRLCPVLFHS